ncbi:hypothetical protein IAT38_001558 [Cryptococcus sp. DSM 104549]
MVHPTRTIKLNDGNDIPVLAFGTGTGTARNETVTAILSAFSTGYTFIDSAWSYKNQADTGRALKESGLLDPLRRGDVFVSTKGGDYDGEPEKFDAKAFLEQGLRELGVDYVDLFLIHADFLVGSIPGAWKQMEQLKKDGLTRSIGVSNFSTKSLEELLASCEIPPAVNQIELHPYAIAHYLPTLLPLCAKHSIAITAYGSLKPITSHTGGPVNPVVTRVAAERALGETDGQILLRWAQEVTGGTVVTTSGKEDRMKEQLAPFLRKSTAPPLTEEQKDAITKAGCEAPWRHWGNGYPYFMKGEGGVVACPPDADWRIKPAGR